MSPHRDRLLVSSGSHSADVLSVDAPRPGFLDRLLLKPILSPLSRTIGLFLGPVADLAVRREQDGRAASSEDPAILRGRHVLTTSENGALRCVACSLCRAACPARCIHPGQPRDRGHSGLQRQGCA